MKITDEHIFDVRYVDYGNIEVGLPRKDIYPWESMLEVIPPQAISCCLTKASPTLKEKTDFTVDEILAFYKVMKKSSPMQMSIKESFSSPVNGSNSKPGFSVSLRGVNDGLDIVDKLQENYLFHTYFDVEIRSSSLVPCSTKVLLKDLDPCVPTCLPPEPIHLDDLSKVPVDLEDPPSPIPPKATSKAVNKVWIWNCSTESNLISSDIKGVSSLNNNGLHSEYMAPILPSLNIGV